MEKDLAWTGFVDRSLDELELVIGRDLERGIGMRGLKGAGGSAVGGMGGRHG